MISTSDTGNLILLFKNVGKAVRSARKRRGLTQAALAAGCRIHVSHLSKIERGLANVTLASLFRIAAPLEVTLAELLDQIGPPDAGGHASKC